ncbi:MAG TPA: hypothetical protein VH593_08330 [Ktedonobacteraceae bacterium]
MRTLHFRLELGETSVLVHAYEKSLNEAEMPRGDIPGGLSALVKSGLIWRARFGMRGNLTLYRVAVPGNNETVEALLEVPPELVSLTERMFRAK